MDAEKPERLKPRDARVQRYLVDGDFNAPVETYDTKVVTIEGSQT